MWRRKREPVIVPDDIGEAQEMRAESRDELKELQRQIPEVNSLARKLQRRRELNHFGTELSVTFRPRGGHA